MKDQARFLRALGDETKLKIIQCLLSGGCCACRFGTITQRAQSTISTHLNDLERVGILESKRDGRNICYKIHDKRVYEICRIIGIKKQKLR